FGVFFFFSSRRRHTRFKCDWSSDVCSSDLLGRCARERVAVADRDPGRRGRGARAARHARPVPRPPPPVRVRSEIERLIGRELERSEERRVGKEWRARGWTDEYNDENRERRE